MSRIKAPLVEMSVLILMSVPKVATTSPFFREVVESAGIVGKHTATAVDAKGIAHIAYFSVTDSTVKYASRAGNGWTTETVDAAGSYGGGSPFAASPQVSLALDAQDNPHITYFNRARTSLRHATKSGGVWSTETVDPLGNGMVTSVVVDAAGNPRVAYARGPALWYGSKGGGVWTLEFVAPSSGNLISCAWLALDAAGNPRIAFGDHTGLGTINLKYTSKSGGVWTTEIVDSSPTVVGEFASLALDVAGNPCISYYDGVNGDLDYAKKAAGVWSLEIADAGGVVGAYNSLALDSQGNPRISYYDDTNDDLKYAAKASGIWAPETVDDIGNVGQFSSLALYAQDGPNIGYFDVTNGDLKYASWRPAILSITDVRKDQGHQVRVKFSGLYLDRVGSTLPITQYEVFRRIDFLAAPQVGSSGVYRSTNGGAAPWLPEGALLAGWEIAGITPAHGETEYNLIVPTLADSGSAGPAWSAFIVRAATGTPTTFFDSAIDSGYSVDNIAPAAPSGFTFTPPANLNWDKSADPDFAYFSVYGSSSGTLNTSSLNTSSLEVQNGQATLIAHTSGTFLNVQLYSYEYYHITATDISGNEGRASSTLNTVAVPVPGEVPLKFALWPNRPNPFASSTFITFDLPAAERVRVRIFDPAGAQVKTLVDAPMEARRYSIVWRGEDDRGQQVNPGVYFYRLEAGPFLRTGKAIKMP